MRYLANKTTWRCTKHPASPFANRRSSSRRANPRHGGVRVHEREEKRNAACRPRLGACSAHARFRLLSCTLPVAVRDGAAAVRDSTAAATRRRTRHTIGLEVPVALRLACQCSEQAAREKDAGHPRRRRRSSRAPRNTARSGGHVKLIVPP